MTFKGTRWFKCDFHLHTPRSQCFMDQSITSEQWVQQAIDRGLHCVAVTDHNTGHEINAIKEAAEGKNLTIFPGVEITCDTSKIHVLILFDVDKTSEDVRDFLVKSDIDAINFGTREAHSHQSILQIAELAHRMNCLVIPAHIDEYNGLSSASFDNLEELYKLDNINAVQVVHDAFLTPNLQTSNNEELKAYLNEYYNTPSPGIDDATIKAWYTPVKLALKYDKALLAFSDNPHGPNQPKHGLWGIGRRYSWIKMQEQPSLESLRQAFLLAQSRICRGGEEPYKPPVLWIKSVNVLNTGITEQTIPLSVEFSPQLTTIIGGRGSGKSSILRFLRGVFTRIAELDNLPDILKDQQDFYKKFDAKTSQGVFLPQSKIEIVFSRNNREYRITADQIEHSEKQRVAIERFNSSDGTWESVDEEGFVDFFEFEHYSQKQIYEIAQQPNSLRERIDKAIDDIQEIRREQELIKRRFLESSATTRTIQQRVAGKGKLLTEIKDLEERIKIYQQSHIAQLFVARETFSEQKKCIDDFLDELQLKTKLFDDILQHIELPAIQAQQFSASHGEELQEFSEEAVMELKTVKSALQQLKEKVAAIAERHVTRIEGSSWMKAYHENLQEFEAQKEMLRQKGVEDIENFERLTTLRDQKEEELEQIIDIEEKLPAYTAERAKLQKEYTFLSERIGQERSEFVRTILRDEKVKIAVKPFRDQVDFERKLRKILQRDSSFDNDIRSLKQVCFTGEVKRNIHKVRQIFKKLRAGEDVERVSGHLKRLVTALTDEQLDELDLLLPEDEVEVLYKPLNSERFKPLATASAGQKTTAILTFILSYGDTPLILDQPEDDLDNRLVYGLVVDRLKKAKEKRQLIVVSHNANIPVNGDAEYVISMNSESPKIQTLATGSVDEQDIKSEICDVMEGSEYAFNMRSKRYQTMKRNT